MSALPPEADICQRIQHVSVAEIPPDPCASSVEDQEHKREDRKE